MLILLVILALSVPIYWHTRINMEQQLTRFMQSNLAVLKQNVDQEQMALFRDFTKAVSIKTELDSLFKPYLQNMGLRSIYLINQQGVILYSIGDKKSAVQAVMRHQSQVQKMRAKESLAAPLFQDNEGNYIKSVFSHLDLNQKNAFILGMDANALFLEKAAILRRQLIYIGISVLMISLLMAFFLSQSLTRPLDRLIRYAALIGKGRPVSIQLRNRRDEIGFLGETMQTMQDNIKQREKENKQLIASIAHEIKNPLGGMRVNAELLLEEAKKYTDLHQYAQAVDNEIRHLSEIVETFLNYARPLGQNIESCEIHDILIAAQQEVQQAYDTDRVKIKGEARAFIHPGKMRRAFYNLIKNACEASAKDAPITVKIIPTSDELLIRFKNYGVPIPQAQQSQIFDAFFTTRETGVGLGLSISKSIVEQHGGQLYLDHSDETGTEFVIVLPGKKGMS